MTDDPTQRNRLADEESPYLRQHADNPVNWQPWDDVALAAAKEREAPIFLSIGYSACHWCHVMEEESFADEETAAILNEHFVPIKVDREERPDLDSVYMSICQQVTGRGGWPLSAWLTPEGKPFYVGTYFPPEPKGNMPAFADLCQRLADSWADPDERPDMKERARQWTEAIESDVGSVPDQPSEAPGADVLSDAASTAIRGADREYGGWGGRGGPKFPQPRRIRLLLEAAAETDRDPFREVATGALDAMVAGGLCDHVGGGFHRYCTDREWVVPHFEKMLYDNAEIPRALLAGYQVTGESHYAHAVSETIDFLERELRHPDGGFYSTLGARSEGPDGEQEEGAFYVWTPESVGDAVADDTAAELFCERFGVDERGNFEGESVLTISRTPESLAEEYDMDVASVREQIATAKRQVFDARADRKRPDRDEKVLAGWNGLTVSMLAEAAIVLGEDAHADLAADALDFVEERLWDADAGRLDRRYKDGDVAGPGYLEDYAFLAAGALDLYGATGDVEHLAFAIDLARAIERDFWDADDGTLYFTPATGESLVARPQELGDQSTPSSAGVAATTLGRLAHFAPDEGFEAVVEGILETHGDTIRASPMQHATLVLAAAENALGNVELTLVPESYPDAWRETLSETFIPRRLLAPRPDGDDIDAWLDTIDATDAPPVWAGRDAVDDQPTVYACRDFACSPPQHDLVAALDWALDGESE